MVNSSIVSGGMPSPGLKVFTNISPTTIAIHVVKIRMEIVRTPILLKVDISLRSETPFTSDTNISGIAINLSNRIKIVPKGAIQSKTKSFPQLK